MYLQYNHWVVHTRPVIEIPNKESYCSFNSLNILKVLVWYDQA